MPMSDSADITQWLDAARGGNREALDRVLGTLYDELHAMARRQLAGQQEQTLDATALVHEAYLKLIGSHGAEFGDRAHFFAYAATAMRSVVVDHVRQRLAQKRGGGMERVTSIPEDGEGAIRLDEDARSRILALMEQDRRARGGRPAYDRAYVQRDVIASERIEGVDAREWVRGAST